jgi:UDP:flavonoid glycosyltransferase YjiC (YdhE family)
MPRVLVTVQPLESHVRAIQHVAHTLHVLGHDVLIATPSKMQKLVEKTYDLPYAEAGQDWTSTPGIGEQLANALVSGGNEAFCRTIISDYLTGPTALAKAKDVAAVVGSWRPDAILADCTDLGSLVTAWQHDIPCVALDNGWTRVLSEYRHILFDGMRHQRWAGVDTDEFLTSYKPPIITPCPRELIYPDIPNITDYRVEHPRRVGERLPGWAANIPPDRPLIYASFGSILTQASGFNDLIGAVYSRIIAGLREIHCTAVLSVGSSNVSRLSEDVPPHIRLVGRIDQPLLLQASVDAILFPGGLGTVKEVLTNGIPSIVMPHWSEGFHIARRFVATGLGVEVPFAAPPEQIEFATQRILGDPTYAQVSRLWQRRSLSLPPLEAVLSKLLP